VPAVADGRADALARLLHGSVREADDGEGRQALGQVDLDLDDGAIQTGGRPGEHP
jgi:hypothetical protein